jgi:chemotaxis protein methyltransferase CheR
MTLLSPPLATAHTESGTILSPYIARIRDLIYQEAGILYADNRLRTLQERCEKRMGEAGALSLQTYFEHLTVGPARRSEINSLLNNITVGETCFFRNQPQLDALRRIVLPRVVEAQSKTQLRRIRMWSAGCSTGEEPYTLAMLALEEKTGILKDCTVDIQATDLNEVSLEHANKGLYGDYSVRNLTPYFRQKYFTPSGNCLQVNPSVQALVTFSRVNLFDPARVLFMKAMDVIFCCNVLIYFDSASKKTVIQHFYSSLQKHGYLFLGHSESLYGITDDFRLVHLPSATAYVKADRNPMIT